MREINSRRLRWTGHVARMKEDRSAFKIFNGRSLGRPRHRWEDNIRIKCENLPYQINVSVVSRLINIKGNIRMGLKEIGINTKNWNSAHDRDYWRTLVNVALNLQVL